MASNQPLILSLSGCRRVMTPRCSDKFLRSEQDFSELSLPSSHAATRVTTWFTTGSEKTVSKVINYE